MQRSEGCCGFASDASAIGAVNPCGGLRRHVVVHLEVVTHLALPIDPSGYQGFANGQRRLRFLTFVFAWGCRCPLPTVSRSASIPPSLCSPPKLLLHTQHPSTLLACNTARACARYVKKASLYFPPAPHHRKLRIQANSLRKPAAGPTRASGRMQDAPIQGTAAVMVLPSSMARAPAVHE